MSDPFETLRAAFQHDHAIVQRGLHELSVALRGNDLLSAKRIADRIDREAGPHVHFEQVYFYPALRALIGDDEVDRFLADHEAGRAALAEILMMPDEAWPDRKRMRQLLGDIEQMSRHLAECSEQFAAMRLIPLEEQRAMLAMLDALRGSNLCWTDLSAKIEAD